MLKDTAYSFAGFINTNSDATLHVSKTDVLNYSLSYTSYALSPTGLSQPFTVANLFNEYINWLIDEKNKQKDGNNSLSSICVSELLYQLQVIAAYFMHIFSQIESQKLNDKASLKLSAVTDEHSKQPDHSVGVNKIITEHLQEVDETANQALYKDHKSTRMLIGGTFVALPTLASVALGASALILKSINPHTDYMLFAIPSIVLAVGAIYFGVLLLTSKAVTKIDDIQQADERDHDRLLGITLNSIKPNQINKTTLALQNELFSVDKFGLTTNAIRATVTSATCERFATERFTPSYNRQVASDSSSKIEMQTPTSQPVNLELVKKITAGIN